MMAFLTLEDLTGTVEVILFSRDFEKNRTLTEPDNKVFIRGRVSAEEERAAKFICQEIIPFSLLHMFFNTLFDNADI